jgi:minor extracellular serine protease Vpr
MHIRNLNPPGQSVILAVVFWIASLSPSFAQFAPNRYTLILEDPPVSARFATKGAVRSAQAADYRRQIEAKQRTLRNELASRHIQVTGSAVTLLNAVFVVVPADRVAELKSLPGVKAVIQQRRYHMKLNRATQLVNAPAAWDASGGIPNAGSGVKIAILDSGIDQTHPAFQDSSLPMPPGYPICSGSDCAFTNNKVIVARSYVRQLAAGSSMANPAADSRPDDYSPRDRDGHGTAVASCAAGVTNTGLVTITGMAPKAYLGNYKIYGSPEVNDSTTDGVIIQALEDALGDGMDIVSFSSGGPAFSGPLDSGSVCGNSSGVPCDLVAQAFENAARDGMTIVAAAGNEGADGNQYPTFNSISSPADAPSVIAAGASTNSHIFLETVSVPGTDAPSNLQDIATRSGNAYVPTGAVTAPLRDVTQLGDDGYACSALPAGSLNGFFALIERGPASNPCTFAAKATNAGDAGAVGVIFYMEDQSPTIGPDVGGFALPAVMISNSDGLALKSFIGGNPERLVTIDGAGLEQDSLPNQLAYFSSFGPSTGDSAVKPDLVAPGTSMYMAGQNYDPLGALYTSNGYAAADGTSFATPLISGAAALVKQNHPNFTGAQIKSALVNTAGQEVTTEDLSGASVGVQWLGAGKLDAGAAVNASVTASPATISFGVLNSGSLPATRQIEITNSGPGAVTLAIAAGQTPGATLTLDKQSLSLAPNASDTISVRLSGSVPSSGSYSGAITIQGSEVSLRVPYLYLVGDGAPYNMIPLTGSNFDGTVSQGIPEGIISFKVVDRYGVPVSGAPVSWTVLNGGTVQFADTATDAYGVAAAQPILGSLPGVYSYRAVVPAAGPTMRLTFSGNARLAPTIAANGVVNAASFEANPAAPGSYISIFGSGLSDTSGATSTAILPLAIDYVNVSFDVPAAQISVPGHLTYVSPGQINVQVPWELQGLSSAQVKVTIDYSNGNVATVPLSDYAPAFFEIAPGVVAALDVNNKVVGAENPVPRGQAVQLFANGLGPVSNQPASGDPAPSSPPFAETTLPPVVMIGGQEAPVSFSGLAPGFAGLYQINVTVPSSLTPGAHPITVAIGGQTSKASGISVQ